MRQMDDPDDAEAEEEELVAAWRLTQATGPGTG
jgi:hypothetical protein